MSESAGPAVHETLTDDHHHPWSAFLVDDQADMRLLLRTIIEIANEGLYVSGEAASGDEALAHLDADSDADVIVLDQMMPGRDGLSTAREIRRRRPDQMLVLCSAYLDTKLEARARAEGVETCIAKGDLGRLPEIIGALRRPR